MSVTKSSEDEFVEAACEFYAARLKLDEEKKTNAAGRIREDVARETVTAAEKRLRGMVGSNIQERAAIINCQVVAVHYERGVSITPIAGSMELPK